MTSGGASTTSASSGGASSKAGGRRSSGFQSRQHRDKSSNNQQAGDDNDKCENTPPLADAPLKAVRRDTGKSKAGSTARSNSSSSSSKKQSAKSGLVESLSSEQLSKITANNTSENAVRKAPLVSTMSTESFSDHIDNTGGRVQGRGASREYKARSKSRDSYRSRSRSKSRQNWESKTKHEDIIQRILGYDNPSSVTLAVTNVKSSFDESKYSDIKVVFGNKKYDLHCVMLQQSAYFKTHIERNMSKMKNFKLDPIQYNKSLASSMRARNGSLNSASAGNSDNDEHKTALSSRPSYSNFFNIFSPSKDKIEQELTIGALPRQNGQQQQQPQMPKIVHGENNMVVLSDIDDEDLDDDRKAPRVLRDIESGKLWLEIVSEDLTQDAVEIALKELYGFEKQINPTNVLDVLTAACYFEMDSVANKCLRLVLEEALSPGTIIDYVNKIDSLPTFVLKEKADMLDDVILKYIVQLVNYYLTDPDYKRISETETSLGIRYKNCYRGDQRDSDALPSTLVDVNGRTRKMSPRCLYFPKDTPEGLLSMLPARWIHDVVISDLLCLRNDFERYLLIKLVLKGLDQDHSVPENLQSKRVKRDFTNINVLYPNDSIYGIDGKRRGDMSEMPSLHEMRLMRAQRRKNRPAILGDDHASSRAEHKGVLAKLMGLFYGKSASSSPSSSHVGKDAIDYNQCCPYHQRRLRNKMRVVRKHMDSHYPNSIPSYTDEEAESNLGQAYFEDDDNEFYYFEDANDSLDGECLDDCLDPCGTCNGCATSSSSGDKRDARVTFQTHSVDYDKTPRSHMKDGHHLHRPHSAGSEHTFPSQLYRGGPPNFSGGASVSLTSSPVGTGIFSSLRSAISPSKNVLRSAEGKLNAGILRPSPNAAAVVAAIDAASVSPSGSMENRKRKRSPNYGSDNEDYLRNTESSYTKRNSASKNSGGRGRVGRAGSQMYGKYAPNGMNKAFANEKSNDDSLENILESAVVYTYMSFPQINKVKCDGSIPAEVVIRSFWFQAELANRMKGGAGSSSAAASAMGANGHASSSSTSKNALFEDSDNGSNSDSSEYDNNNNKVSVRTLAESLGAAFKPFRFVVPFRTVKEGENFSRCITCCGRQYRVQLVSIPDEETSQDEITQSQVSVGSNVGKPNDLSYKFAAVLQKSKAANPDSFRVAYTLWCFDRKKFEDGKWYDFDKPIVAIDPSGKGESYPFVYNTTVEENTSDEDVSFSQTVNGSQKDRLSQKVIDDENDARSQRDKCNLWIVASVEFV